MDVCMDLSKLRLADLILGLNYLDDLADRIQGYIISIEKTDSKEKKLMIKRLQSTRVKAMNFRKEIAKRISDESDIATYHIPMQSKAYDLFWEIKRKGDYKKNKEIHYDIAEMIGSDSAESVKTMIKRETKKREQKRA